MGNKKIKRQYVKNYNKKIIIPITTEVHETLRLISYKHNISLSSIAREGIDMAIKKYFKKSVDTE